MNLLLPTPALVKVLGTLALALGFWRIRNVRRATDPGNDPILIGLFLGTVALHIFMLKPFLGVFSGLLGQKVADFQIANIAILAVLISGWWTLIGHTIQSGVELASGWLNLVLNVFVNASVDLIGKFRGRKPATPAPAEEA